jgi:hypothetical protein
MKIVEFHLAFKSKPEGFVHIKPIMLLSEQMLSSLESILNDEDHLIQFVAITSKDYNGEKLL